MRPLLDAMGSKERHGNNRNRRTGFRGYHAGDERGEEADQLPVSSHGATEWADARNALTWATSAALGFGM